MSHWFGRRIHVSTPGEAYKPGYYTESVIRALIGEAVGENSEGMYRVAKVIHTRALQRKMSVDDVVRQPKQFSAMARTDLDDFILRQPKGTTERAYEAMERAGNEVGKGWA